ncbi:hypothetical protein FA15DRAFT_681740 [Coprinopsis marcescibilis]|uniref:Thioredoxin-like fold domain-containing protein n=1 Tax=Coprinopsis marcescibilis TaxID=230819 RepID=A0A5C3KPU7_COPMA|nr:hypothetical protein FA15DRAFT_681740 [Coprinopsis marcescibilis]
MKFSHFALGCLAFGSVSVQAQYFSEGWKPGQPVYETTVAEAEATYTPGQSTNPAVQNPEAPRLGLKELLDPERLLGSVLGKLGVNLTERLNEKIWDDRIPLITDGNYKELIQEEKFESKEEAKDRTWVIAITVSKNRQEPLSKLVDEMFDSAYNKSVLAGDLPAVRWGRIDYFDVTYLTTKWNVWKAPYVVVAKDNGQTLYFFRPGNMRINDDALREFLKTEGYLQIPPWSSIWAPGGEREWLLDIFAVWMAKGYTTMNRIPRWFLLLGSGGLASVLLSFLHKKPQQPPRPPGVEKAGANVAASEPPKSIKSSPESTGNTPTPSSPKPTAKNRPAESPAPTPKRSARQRKGKKVN